MTKPPRGRWRGFSEAVAFHLLEKALFYSSPSLSPRKSPEWFAGQNGVNGCSLCTPPTCTILLFLSGSTEPSLKTQQQCWLCQQTEQASPTDNRQRCPTLKETCSGWVTPHAVTDELLTSPSPSLKKPAQFKLANRYIQRWLTKIMRNSYTNC